MKRLLVLGAILAGGLPIACYMNAPSPAPSAEALAATKIEKVKDNLYIITGSDPNGAFSGGNTAVFITAQGVVLVDTKLPGWGQPILDRIRTVTDKPVTMVINTHSHNDHTGSNPFFEPSVESIVQENTKANMAKMEAFAGDNAKLLPTRNFKDTLTLGGGADQVDLYFFGAGHTSGDSFVVFPSVGTLHTGDNFPWKALPYIDARNGGSVVSHAETLSKAVAAIKNVDTVITGHTPVLTWNDFAEYAAFTQDFVDWGKNQMAAGKSVEDAAAAYKIPDRFKGYVVSATPDLGGAKANLQMIYDELKRK